MSNAHPLEVADRGSETQLQKGEHDDETLNYRVNGVSTTN